MGRASAHKNRAGPLERNTPDRSRPINACWQIVALRRMEIACVRLLSRLLGFFAAQVLILIALCFPHRCARFAGAEPASRAEGTCADVHLSDVEGRCLTRQAAVHMLDPYALEEFVLKHELVLVGFCSADDGRCRLLAPEMQQAAIDGATSGFKFVHIKADNLARAIYGVHAVPTLRFFVHGRMDPEDYAGRRLAADLLDAANARAAKVAQSSARMTQSLIVDLTSASLHDITHNVLDTSLFVLFYMTPCPALLLELEAVAVTFQAHANITVGKLDVVAFPEAVEPYAAHGTPLLVFFGQADPFFGFKPKEVVYADMRVASAMVRFVNRKCGLMEQAVKLDGTMSSHQFDPNTGSLPVSNLLDRIETVCWWRARAAVLDFSPSYTSSLPVSLLPSFLPSLLACSAGHDEQGDADRDAPSWIFTPAGHAF